jgi:hypothetical protein
MLLSLLALSLMAPVPARADVADATVAEVPAGAGIHGHALFDSWYELGPLGYTEAEYLVSGTASNDAHTATAPYATRIIVTRPSGTGAFNGTVLIDWTNVTAQFENAVDSLEAHEMLLREGFAWVHASVQSAGICCTPLTPKAWDPVRYAALSHPGDAYANDIFSQIAKAVRAPAGIDPMNGLDVERVLASGQSQSASKLYTYVTTVQPVAGVIDGFLIHGGGAKTYDVPPAVPVLHLLSDAEASPAAPNTSENYRLWEIAGTAHSDFWLGYHQVFGQGPRTLADAPKQPATADEDLHAVAGNYGEMSHPLDAACILAGATMPMRYAVSAALHHLNAWVSGGGPPPSGPRFTFNGTTLAQDAFGNTLGGIRYPPIDVPVARYVSTLCALGGITATFNELQLVLLYPTHADYFGGMVERTDGAVAAGWLLPEDAADLLARACAAKVRWRDLGPPGCD